MIIRHMQPQDKAQVLKLSVTEAQMPYVGTIQAILNSLTDDQDCHVLEVKQIIVGFFIVDRAYARQYDFCDPKDIGFRAYLVDKDQQGKGYGKRGVMLLRAYLQAEYADYPGVVLTVNCKNEKAYRIYLDGGFVYNGELYYGGQAGPQHILRMALHY